MFRKTLTLISSIRLMCSGQKIIKKKNLNKTLEDIYNFAESHPLKHMLKELMKLNHKKESLDNEELFYNISSAVNIIKRG